jgi:hypothetical protein
MTPTDFEQPPSYLVLGATGGIGSTLAQYQGSCYEVPSGCNPLAY